MFAALLLVFLLPLGLLSSASPEVLSRDGGETENSDCSHPIVRKEWRTLSRKEQLDYIHSVQCILKKPPITGLSILPGARSRFDDFLGTHIQQTLAIHFVGHFLPWHRFFTATYESALRHECGYTGAQPYWDWTRDVHSDEAFTSSPVFDAGYGFGGNGPFVPLTPAQQASGFAVPGRTGGGCIQDGPFKSMVVSLGPQNSLTYNPRCLARDFSPFYARWYLGNNQTKVTMDQSDFGWFDRVVEGGPSFDDSGVHGGGHYSVGGTLGQMGDLYASPSDPIFYLHHANLDRVWWSWQKKNLPVRLQDVSGPVNLLDYSNTEGGNVTLDFPLSIGLNAPNVTIRDTMNIQGGVLCYDYDELYRY